MALIKDQIKEIEKLYRQYLGKKTLQEYLTESRKNNIGDEETTTDPLFRDMLQSSVLWGYGGDNVLLQQQKHKITWNGENKIAKPDFETNNEFCKIPILFDSKSSNISFEEMTSGGNTVFETTFKRYLIGIKPEYKYIIGFNLEYIFLYERIDEKNITTKIIVNVLKLLEEDKDEIKNLSILLDETGFKQISMEDKITILKNKKYEDAPFNTELFFEKYINTRDKLQMFFISRLKNRDITRENCDIDVQRDLPDSDNEDEFREQLANRLTMIEFFKYIFIRTYEDFGLIHFSEEDKKIIPISYGKVINNLEAKGQTGLFNDFLNTFFEEYITKISEQGITDIGKEYFDGFLTLFKKYEGFIGDLVIDNRSKFDYYNILFDIIFFLNEFNFRELGDDIIGGLYEKTLDREDRKKFGQFYTPRYIIDFIIDALAIKPSENIKVADVSCGTGGFLVKYLDRIKGDLLNDNSKLIDIFKGAYGVDIKEFSVLLTKLNIALMFILKNKALKDYNLETKKIRLSNIIQGDGLGIQNSLPIKDGDLDYVVGNPPYVGVKNNADIFLPIRNDDFFGNFFGDRSDLYYYFIIQGIKKLKPNGKLGYIIPRERITSDSGYKLRKYILDNCMILGIIDFNGISIFEDAGTTSCLLFLQKCENKENAFSFVKFNDYKKKNLVKYIESNRDSLHKKTSSEYGEAKDKIDSGYEIFSNKIMKYTNFRKILDSINKGENFDISFLGGITSGKIVLNNYLSIKKIKQSDLSEKPWLLGDKIVASSKTKTLGEIFTTSQGIVTGSDKVKKAHIEKKNLVPKDFLGKGIFVLKEGEEIRGAGLSDVVNGSNSIGNIELNINGSRTALNDKEKQKIKPFYSGSNLNKRNVSKNNLFMIYSYFEDVKYYKGNDFDNEFIKQYFPNIYNYCYMFIDILKSRGGDHFKPLAKKGNFLCFSDPKYDTPFDKPKITFTTKGDYKFCYNEIPLYGTGGGAGGLSYIYINENNPITKIVRKFSNDNDYLKFVNAILNSILIKNFLHSNSLNTLSLDKIRDIVEIPEIDFENQEDIQRYNEIVDITNQLIQLEKEDNNISVKKKGDEESFDIHSEEFMNLLQRDVVLKESSIGMEISVGNVDYMVIGLNSEEFLARYNDGIRNFGKLLGINILNQKEKMDAINNLNDRIDVLVKELYGD